MSSLPLECPSCQERFPTGSRFCPHDGAVLLDRTAFEQPPTDGPSPGGRGDAFRTILTPRASGFAGEETDEETDVDAPPMQPLRGKAPPFLVGPPAPGPAAAAGPAAFSGPSASGAPVASAAPPKASPGPPPAKKFAGRYELGALIGQGGMGRIYRATHVDLGKQVAVKILRSDVVQSEENAIRFMREARATSAIGHPNIVDVTDLGTLEDGRPYFVMELLQGSSLHEVIQRGRAKGSGRFETSRAVEIACQLASALQAAHATGIVHRDMKAGNVFVCGDPATSTRIKLLDFGIAKLLYSESRITRAGAVFGTPHYMAPEQCRGTEVDHRADIYSLGVIFFEMLTGELPFDDPVDVYILAKHVKDPIPPLPPEFAYFDPFIRTALAKEPNDRFATIADFERELRAAHEAAGGPKHAAAADVHALILPQLSGSAGVGNVAPTLVQAPLGEQSGAPTLVRASADDPQLAALAQAPNAPNSPKPPSLEAPPLEPPTRTMPRWQLIAFVIVCFALGVTAAFFFVRGLSPSSPTSTSLQ